MNRGMSMLEASLRARLAECVKARTRVAHAYESLQNKDTPYGLEHGELIEAYTEIESVLRRYLPAAPQVAKENGMNQILVYGASDDLIEIDGQTLRAEFSPSPEEEGTSFLAFGDGTLLRVRYDDEGCWRIDRIAAGASHYEHDSAIGPDAERREDGSSGYSDRVRLTGWVGWVALAVDFNRDTRDAPPAPGAMK